MPRGPRLDAPGTLHHVMARGLDRQSIFRDNRDREDFLLRLRLLEEAGAFTIYSWALLSTHFHLLVRTGNRPLPRFMRSLLTGYAGVFNRRHRRAGHLFQNRYRSVVVEEEPYFLELVRYLHLNPIRAGLVSDLSGLDRYPYCGHAALMGNAERPWQDTETVLRRFAVRPRAARERYRVFVAEGLGQGRRPELVGGGLVRSAGGRDAVRDLHRAREIHAADERILGGSEFVTGVLRQAARTGVRALRGRWRNLDAAALLRKVCQAERLPVEGLLGGGRRPAVCRVREGIAYLWVEHLGRSGRKLSAVLGIRPESVYRAARRGADDQERWRRILEGKGRKSRNVP